MQILEWCVELAALLKGGDGMPTSGEAPLSRQLWKGASGLIPAGKQGMWDPAWSWSLLNAGLCMFTLSCAFLSVSRT